MALPSVTAADLKARYPAFEAVGNTLVDLVLADARGTVAESWITADQKPAILAYAAHLLSLEGYGGETVTVGTEDLAVTGAVEMVKIGDASVKFAGGAAERSGSAGSNADLASTAYGRRYLDLLRRSNPGVLVL